MSIFRLLAHSMTIAAFYFTVGIHAAYSNQPNIQIQNVLTNVSTKDIECLQKNVYFEAGNQSMLGKAGVAWVTLNRMESSRYPDTICEVVKQGLKNADGSMKRYKCQFSWYCDGKSDQVPDNIIEQYAWQDSGLVVSAVLIDWIRAKQSPVANAVMYHAEYVNPYWASSYNVVRPIEKHIFYE